MKQYRPIIYLACLLLLSQGCTTTFRSVEPLSEEETLATRGYFTALPKIKAKHGQQVIGIRGPSKKYSMSRSAETLRDCFLLTPMVSEIGYMTTLSREPDWVIESITPHEQSTGCAVTSVVFGAITLGIVPIYREVHWGCDFEMVSTTTNERIPFSLNQSSYRLFGWVSIFLNFMPGWQDHCSCEEYRPFEADCRLLRQLLQQMGENKVFDKSPLAKPLSK